VPYLSALEVCSRRDTIQIHVHVYLYLTFTLEDIRGKPRSGLVCQRGYEVFACPVRMRWLKQMTKEHGRPVTGVHLVTVKAVYSVPLSMLVVVGR